MRLHHRITAATATAALALSAAFVAAAPATATATDSATSSSATAASTATFDGVSITGLKKKQKQKGTVYEVAFNLRIAGSAPDTSNVRYTVGTPEVVQLKSRVKTGVAPYVSRNYEGAVGDNPLRLTILSTSAPGLYEVRIPVTQRDLTTYAEVTKTATKRFQLHATKKYSKSKTYIYSNRWDSRTAAKFTINAPRYQRGAKVTMIYKKKGAKAVKIGTKKLKAKKGEQNKYNSTVVFTTRKLGRSGKITFKFSKAKWAPKYKLTGRVKTG